MYVDVSLKDGIAELLLNHPPVNAFPSAGWSHLAQVVASLGADDAVRVVVIAAEGRGFCAGIDVKELARDATRRGYKLYARNAK